MRRLYIPVAVILIFTGMIGCTPEKDSAVTITVVTPFDQEDGHRSNFVKAYQAYESASGNIVKDEAATSNEAWKTKIMEDFKNGNEPDVLFYFTGADANELVKENQLVSLDEIRAQYPDYASNMKGSMMPVSTYNGRQYAVPVDGYWEGLFVNKKVLEECGVAVPGADYAWEQFLEDCRIIKDKGYTPIACSLMEVPHYWFEYCTFNHGDLLNHASLPENAEDAVGSIWAAGLRDIAELYSKGFFPEDTLTATDKETNQLMTRNEAAFMIDGSWKVGWFQENAADISDFTVTYVPSKGERKPTDIIGGLSMGYYIAKKAWDDPKKRDACVSFIEAMTTDEVVSSFGELSITALKNGTKSAENTDALVLSALAMTKNVTGTAAAAQDMLKQSARDMLFADIRNVATGIVTPETAIDKCLGMQK